MPSTSSLKEMIKALGRCVTTAYPFGPAPTVLEGFRGKIEFDKEKCTACAACVQSCPTGAMSMQQTESSRIIENNYGKCSFCGRCVDVCPEDALRSSNAFELAGADKTMMISSNEVSLAKCVNCGGLAFPELQLKKMAERVLENVKPETRGEVQVDLQKFPRYCVDCRRLLSYRLDTHTRKYY